ncbi:lipopolysaccharide biosynthesis protein [Leeuwenhoekiella aestuarii]|uniref:Na+-driven multidrug efflux pump n=1 Tax=Leeuwenhoekiella aestuarii TaxID=2249426 RepID=A0A4Q0NRQ8_9FLAO|nr:hypothetical protein [Leeuwenhoekiella aestuarii]RXG13094.1 Na+-driven multidrug efflux pump [Leeuwenhoekiella aestuarii]
MSLIYKSIAKNYFASSFGMGITFLNQIAMVPLFITLWSVEKYADWILITSISTVFAMTNLGLNDATANMFVLKYQSKEYDECKTLLINSFLFIGILGLIFLTSAGLVGFIVGFKTILGVHIFSGLETNISFILLLLNVFVKMYGGAYKGIYRVKSKAHTNSMIENFVRLLEIIILFVGIFWDFNIISILLFYNLPSLASIIYRSIHTSKWFNVKFSIFDFKWTTFKRIVKPSISFMLMPLGYAFSNQGIIFVVSGILGPVVLVIFTTTRTLINFLRSVTNLFGNSVYPEISLAYGAKKASDIFKLFYRSFAVTLLTSILSVIIILFFGKEIYLRWTNHEVEFNGILFMGLLSVFIIANLWNIISVFLLATNNHYSFTRYFFLKQLLEVILVYIVLKVYSSINLVPVVMFFTEIILLILTFHSFKSVFNFNFKEIPEALRSEISIITKKIKPN